jgi:hypothetical protein
MKARLAIVVALVSLSGCALKGVMMAAESPVQLTGESNYNLCRAASSVYATTAIDAEIARRKIDCNQYAAAIAQARSHQQDAISRSLESRPRAVTTNCTGFGNSVTCTTN